MRDRWPRSRPDDTPALDVDVIPNSAHVFDEDGEPIGGIVILLDDG
jgi:hypothetical protein